MNPSPDPGKAYPPPGLPAGWDLSRDVLVLCGRGAPEALAGLPEAARAIAYLPGPSSDEPAPAGGPTCHDQGELLRWLLQLPGPLPRRLQVASTGDPWAGPERRKEIAALAERALVSRRIQASTLATSGPRWL